MANKPPACWMGTADNKHFIVTDDKDELPVGATAIPLQQPPTEQNVATFLRQGCTIEYRWVR